ncbi:uncharacterized protein si:ch73-6k14.2 isoform X1 [Danio rerio]|uniref:Uncharacterized protein si:ch73-6k14.2 isoform X1 n=2 Tax=Danio rerio TaxID=7955 RepID=A0AC58JW56_DANRE|nr:uncharacterized protein si:ch73-6k14.2 [Danio rerio]|eukprot:XP_021332890.1 uncharacterized protein si:ch73-6k14.2 [Danio rerio]
MKPRRRRPSVDLLPTIAELQESELQAQSLEEYMESIRELSQPSYPLSGPLQRSRLCPLRTARFPSMSLAHRPWAISRPDNASLTLNHCKCPNISHQDPLDWLFAQTQHTIGTPIQSSPEDLAMI